MVWGGGGGVRHEGRGACQSCDLDRKGLKVTIKYLHGMVFRNSVILLLNHPLFPPPYSLKGFIHSRVEKN